MINASRSGPTFQRFSRQCGGTELSLAAVFLRAQLADEIGFERAGRVVPFQSFAVPVPQFETVLLLAVLVAEIIGLAGVPIGESQRTTRRQPEKASLFSLVGSRSPKVFIAVTCFSCKQVNFFFCLLFFILAIINVTSCNRRGYLNRVNLIT